MRLDLSRTSADLSSWLFDQMPTIHFNFLIEYWSKVLKSFIINPYLPQLMPWRPTGVRTTAVPILTSRQFPVNSSKKFTFSHKKIAFEKFRLLL